MKIIFLDFDGVLNSEIWYRRRFGEMDMDSIVSKYPYYEFDPLAIEQLNRIISETSAKVVISSTWRIGRTIENLQQMLDAVGFKGEVIDTTPHFFAKGMDNSDNKISYTIPRGCEIDWWLSEKGKFQRINWSIERQREYMEKALVKKYVILDDDSDMLYSQREHFVHTGMYYGLNEKKATEAIKILNTPLEKIYGY